MPDEPIIEQTTDVVATARMFVILCLASRIRGRTKEETHDILSDLESAMFSCMTAQMDAKSTWEGVDADAAHVDTRGGSREQFSAWSERLRAEFDALYPMTAYMKLPDGTACSGSVPDVMALGREWVEAHGGDPIVVFGPMDPMPLSQLCKMFKDAITNHRVAAPGSVDVVNPHQVSRTVANG